MKPSAIAVDFGASDPEDFEEVPYPANHNHWSTVNREEELPLHYMSEEKARRRVKATTTSSAGGPEEYEVTSEKERYPDYYDDESKYNKVRPHTQRIGSGRMPQAPFPPPTSIVRPYHTPSAS